MFLWEFTGDSTFKRKVEIKYYALDEVLGLVGGNLSLLLALTSYFVGPYSLVEFIVENSSKKEEIEMQIGQAVKGPESETISKYEDALNL